MVFEKNVPSGFDGPTSSPSNPEQRRQWQEANRAWWQNHPMRYDWKDNIGHEEFTKEFYEEVDYRFFSNVREFMPWREIPFDPIMDFAFLSDKDVLEIGVGNGTHAQLLAGHCRSFSGIDISEYATKSTSRRMELSGLRATIRQMDAEDLEFDDNSFDLIWSWGVIHHSSNTEAILKEMRRVLRSDGQAVTMVYHRNVWSYYFLGFMYGMARGEFFKTWSIHHSVQHMTDGAIARYYSTKEWKSLANKYFAVEKIKIFGQKSEVVPLPGGKLKQAILKTLPDSVGRFFTNRLRLGTFLVSFLRKVDS